MSKKILLPYTGRGGLPLFLALIVATVSGLSPPSSQAMAESIVVVVPGTSNPWLAGMPDGSTEQTGDIAPAQSPVLVPVILEPGTAITFTATGGVAQDPRFPLMPPDGNPADLAHHGGSGAFIDAGPGAVNGIADVIAPMDSLLGIFLGTDRPDSTSAPPRLQFSSMESRDYLILSPVLKQVFFIGDGLAESSQAQQVIVPADATRLFLATMDGIEWSNNIGSFTVNVTGVRVIPEPASGWLLGVAILAMVLCGWPMLTPRTALAASTFQA